MHASLSLFAAALVGSAAANQIPKSAWIGKSAWPTGSSSSSSSLSTVSSSSYVHSSSSKPTISPPLSTAPTSTHPHPSKTTEVLTSFTTTTVCPITYTRWHHSSAEIVTSYTTSTLTVTSCKSGCNHHPTSYSVPPASNTTVSVAPTKSSHPPHHGGGQTLTTVYPTTVTTSYTKFVPCSTPVATSAGTTYYSTWLTPTALPTSYVSTCTDTYTLAQPTKTPVAPVESCPAVKTVTVTVDSGAKPTPPPKDCKSCYEVHTLTLTNGQTSVITLTHTKPPHKPTSTHPLPSGTGSPKPSGSGSLPSGSASGYPQGTGNLVWHKPSPTKAVW